MTIKEEWPDSWKYSYSYDLKEVYGDVTDLGYTYAYQCRRDETFRLVTEVLSPGARILDVAAAQGNFSLALAEMGYQVTWNDLRPDLAEYVHLKHDQGNIQYASGNAFELQFPSLFDGVLITEIIEHVAHPDQFLSKIAQLVKPGGYVVMTTPNGAYIRNNLPKFSECEDAGYYETAQFKPDVDGHIFLLHPDEIKPFADKATLNIEEIALFTNSLTNGHVKTAPLLRFIPKPLVFSIERASRTLPFFLRQKLMVHMAVRFRKAPPCA